MNRDGWRRAAMLLPELAALAAPVREAVAESLLEASVAVALDPGEALPAPRPGQGFVLVGGALDNTGTGARHTPPYRVRDGRHVAEDGAELLHTDWPDFHEALAERVTHGQYTAACVALGLTPNA